MRRCLSHVLASADPSARRRRTSRARQRALATPSAHAAAPAPQAPHRQPRQRCSGADRPPMTSRSLFEPTLDAVPVGGRVQQHRRRSGALPALPGHARRRAVHRLPLLRARTRRALAVSSRRGQRRLARSAILRQLRADRPLHDHRALGPDPAVLQRRHEDAVHRRRRSPLLLDDATQQRSRTGRRTSSPTSRSRRSSICASGATSATFDVWRDADAAARPDGGVHDARGTGRAAVGRAASASATTSRWRCRTTRGPTTSPSAREWTNSAEHAARRVQRLVVQQPRRHARSGTARCG